MEGRNRRVALVNSHARANACNQVGACKFKMYTRGRRIIICPE